MALLAAKQQTGVTQFLLHYRKWSSLASLWPAYVLRHVPLFTRLVFANEKACSQYIITQSNNNIIMKQLLKRLYANGFHMFLFKVANVSGLHFSASHLNMQKVILSKFTANQIV